MGKVLITGGSGMIGTRLTTLLLKRGAQIHHLGRSLTTKRGPRGASRPTTNAVSPFIKSFAWNPEKGELDEAALDGVDAVVHLAGANVGEKRWTAARKKEIIDSRVKSAELLYEFLKKENHTVRTFISASAVGYYGDCGDEIIKEERKSGEGFLAGVCKQWEHEAEKIGELGIREVYCRFGIVLSKNGGALPELTKTMPLGFVGYWLKKNLYYPWVHIDDVCGIMIHALEHENVKGPYNTTAPKPLQMKDLMREILKAKKPNAVLLRAPPVAIKLGLGEMSEMLLGSQRCLAEKVILSGYNFKYAGIENALSDIYKKE